MARKIVFTSGKGGVGKTTVAANIGAQLALRGEQVILCDTDFGLNNIDVVTGIEKRITYDIGDVIEGRCRARQALVQHPAFKNLYVLASNHSSPEKYISPQAVRLVLDNLSPQFDYILIDCPAGIEEGFHRAVASAEEAVVVTTPHLSALRDADKVISVLKSYRLKSVQLIVNMVRGDLLLNGDILSPQAIADILKIPLLAVLPESDEVYLNTLTDRKKIFRIAANNLAGGKTKYYDATRQYSGVLGRIRMGLKRSI